MFRFLRSCFSATPRSRPPREPPTITMFFGGRRAMLLAMKLGRGTFATLGTCDSHGSNGCHHYDTSWER